MFDLAHLQRIHHALFKDIYAWTGQLRTVEIAKGDTRFANSDALYPAGIELFARLHTEGLLGGLSGRLYAERLAHYSLPTG